MSGYAAEKLTRDGVDVIRLADSARAMEVSIAPTNGNMAFEYKIHGHNALFYPFESVAEWVKKPTQLGIPLLAPWANRLSSDSFYANGKQYRLNSDVLALRRDVNKHPIHGVLLFASTWNVVKLEANDKGAEVTSRLEFWRYPDWMAQFPFAHTLELTHRLADGQLEVRLAVENLSIEAMPLVVGFHPWYQITDAPRDDWRVEAPIAAHYPLGPNLIPTGVTETPDLPDSFTLAGRSIDAVFGGVDCNRAFTLAGKSQKLSVRFGPKYPIAVLFAPTTRPVVCFEPMTGITDGFNLSHDGLYKDLQTIAPGETWTESFWVKPEGYTPAL